MIITLSYLYGKIKLNKVDGQGLPQISGIVLLSLITYKEILFFSAYQLFNFLFRLLRCYASISIDCLLTIKIQSDKGKFNF